MLSDIGTAAPIGGTCAAVAIDDRDQGLCGTSAPIDTQTSDLNGLTSSTSESAEQEHLDIIDQEEISLPSLSFHDAHGNQISWAEYNRLVDLELEHEASDTLHLLYPDLYEEPVEKCGPVVDSSIYIDKEFHGGQTARVHEQRCCRTLS